MQPDLATSLPALSLDELQPATAAHTHASNVVVPEPLRSLIMQEMCRHGAGRRRLRRQSTTSGPTLLHRALDLGHERLCARMLRTGGEALARAPSWPTLAHVAARRSNVEALRTILRLAPRCRAEDELGWTPLHGVRWREGAVTEYRAGRVRTSNTSTASRATARSPGTSPSSPKHGAPPRSSYLGACGRRHSRPREARLPFVELRWLVAQNRARPVFCVEPETRRSPRSCSRATAPGLRSQGFRGCIPAGSFCTGRGSGNKGAGEAGSPSGSERQRYFRRRRRRQEQPTSSAASGASRACPSGPRSRRGRAASSSSGSASPPLA